LKLQIALTAAYAAECMPQRHALTLKPAGELNVVSGFGHIFKKGISTFPGLAFACLDACMKGWAQRGCEKKKRDKDKSTAKTCLGNDII